VEHDSVEIANQQQQEEEEEEVAGGLGRFDASYEGDENMNLASELDAHEKHRKLLATLAEKKRRKLEVTVVAQLGLHLSTKCVLFRGRGSSGGYPREGTSRPATPTTPREAS
jgi:hypothetical protein